MTKSLQGGWSDAAQAQVNRTQDIIKAMRPESEMFIRSDFVVRFGGVHNKGFPGVVAPGLPCLLSLDRSLGLH